MASPANISSKKKAPKLLDPLDSGDIGKPGVVTPIMKA